MIKARLGTANGVPGVLLGLSDENIKRLRENKPIRVDLAELGLPPTTIFIVAGRTEDHITASLKALGLEVKTEVWKGKP